MENHPGSFENKFIIGFLGESYYCDEQHLLTSQNYSSDKSIYFKTKEKKKPGPAFKTEPGYGKRTIWNNVNSVAFAKNKVLACISTDNVMF